MAQDACRQAAGTSAEQGQLRCVGASMGCCCNVTCCAAQLDSCQYCSCSTCRWGQCWPNVVAEVCQAGQRFSCLGVCCTAEPQQAVLAEVCQAGQLVSGTCGATAAAFALMLLTSLCSNVTVTAVPLQGRSSRKCAQAQVSLPLPERPGDSTGQYWSRPRKQNTLAASVQRKHTMTVYVSVHTCHA
jgi:hypothetical protein